MRLHLLGLCGTFMGGVARLATELGHEVDGSDSAAYEPMAGQLDSLGIRCFEGYDATCADRPADLYLVGNVVTRGNPLFEDICSANRPFCSAPAWLADKILADSGRVIAVAGTHGKTTTASMVAHMLEKTGTAPGYLIGGVLGTTGASSSLGEGDVFVVEADEYDTAFFDKRPKFAHYWSDVTVLSNIEFDHADIYPDLDAVKRQFALLPRTIKPGGTLVANRADPVTCEVVPEQAGWHDVVWTNDPKGWRYEGERVHGPSKKGLGAVNAPAGRHNRDNMLSALAACDALGYSATDALAAMGSYKLPNRRMQVVFESDEAVVIDDFAHHPTSIALAIETARAMFAGRRLVVLFEPRSNTMRMGHWAGSLSPSLAGADKVLALGDGVEWDLAEELGGLGDRARVFGDARSLLAAALEEARPGGAVLLMLSNGDFSGLRRSLPDALGAG